MLLSIRKNRLCKRFIVNITHLKPIPSTHAFAISHLNLSIHNRMIFNCFLFPIVTSDYLWIRMTGGACIKKINNNIDAPVSLNAITSFGGSLICLSRVWLTKFEHL